MRDSATSCSILGLTYLDTEHKQTGFLLEVSGFYPLAMFCFRCNSQSPKPVPAAGQGDHRGSQANTVLYHFCKYCREPVCVFQHPKTFQISLWLLWQRPTFNTTNWERSLAQRSMFVQNLTALRHLSRKSKATTTSPSRVAPHLGISCFHRC